MRFLLISNACLLALLFLSSCPVSPEAEFKRVQIAQPKDKVPGVQDIVFLRAFGGQGEGDGLFHVISGISAGDGVVYVGDADLSRIQVFDYAGKFLYSFGSGLSLKKVTPSPSEIWNRVDVNEAELLSSEAISALESHSLFRTADLAYFEGEILVLNALYSAPNEKTARLVPSILRYTPSGAYLGSLKIPSILPSFFDVDQGTYQAVVNDVLNNGFFTVDLVEGQVLFSSNSKSKNSYSDFLNTIYSTENIERQKVLYQQWTSAGSTDEAFDGISGVAFFRDKILAVDRVNKRIKIYARDGRLLKIVNAKPEGQTLYLFEDPIDIAVTEEGVVFLSDASPTQPSVIAFSPRFTPLFSLRHRGLRQPSSIDVTADDYVFVVDSASKLVFVFGPRERTEAGDDALLTKGVRGLSEDAGESNGS